MSNLIPAVITPFNTILPAVIMCGLCAVIALQFAYIRRCEEAEAAARAEADTNRNRNTGLVVQCDFYKRALARHDNERKEIEVHLYGVIRHAKIEDLCARIETLKRISGAAQVGALIHEMTKSEGAAEAGIALPIVKDIPPAINGGFEDRGLLCEKLNAQAKEQRAIKQVAIDAHLGSQPPYTDEELDTPPKGFDTGFSDAKTFGAHVGKIYPL